MLTQTNLFLLLGSYICANFGENLSRNGTVTVPATSFIMSHAACYSYGQIITEQTSSSVVVRTERQASSYDHCLAASIHQCLHETDHQSLPHSMPQQTTQQT